MLCDQVYKFLYASRLLDCGLLSQAFHYCEVVGQAVLRQQEPHCVLMEELIKVCTLHAIWFTCLIHPINVLHLVDASSRVCICICVCVCVCFPLQLSDRLKFSEGQYSEAGFTAAEQEPEWLKHLQTRHQRLQVISPFISHHADQG